MKTDEQRRAATEYTRRWKLAHPGAQAAATARYRAKHGISRKPESLNGRLVRRYGITEDEYNLMAAEQDGSCAACGQVPTGKRWASRLHVDHDHNTKEVRGLLCGPCNRALGYIEHPMRPLWDAYLERMSG